jgi:hypothetical protein
MSGAKTVNKKNGGSNKQMQIEELTTRTNLFSLAYLLHHYDTGKMKEKISRNLQNKDLN